MIQTRALAAWQSSTLPASPWVIFKIQIRGSHPSAQNSSIVPIALTMKSKPLAMATRLYMTYIFKPSNPLSLFSLQHPTHTNSFLFPQNPLSPRPLFKSMHYQTVISMGFFFFPRLNCFVHFCAWGGSISWSCKHSKNTFFLWTTNPILPPCLLHSSFYPSNFSWLKHHSLHEAFPNCFI